MSSLSKNVLSMKFMQRTKEKIEEKQEVESLFGKAAGDEGKDRPEIEVWKTEDSYAACQGLQFGRMSFRGCNPEVERLMAEKRGEKYMGEAEETEEPADVTVKEMMAQIQKGQVTSNNKNDDDEGQTHRSGQVKRKRSHYIQPVPDD